MRPEGLPSGALRRYCPGSPWPGSVKVHARPVMANPSEGYLQYHGDVWFGAMSGFVYFSGPASMVAPRTKTRGRCGITLRNTCWPTPYAVRLSLTEPNKAAALGYTEGIQFAYQSRGVVARSILPGRGAAFTAGVEGRGIYRQSLKMAPYNVAGAAVV
ncbi:MAG: hypothetical protein JZD41_04865 [Thermoproteus sp.]|nr:hypothetical protein [Thermoproteus sp.]